ncbi:hypothetical protein F0562_001207 [Nyssa sinensis]|uniref:Malic enzyme NAD-binding domain-containing protein n=1 Tax=Nyssa sinensis TaxID=561372 RepID=A0A5J5C368_9ASTE|nr:hypothetical protein F0562_001207 [Nyssa sinensis]
MTLQTLAVRLCKKKAVAVVRRFSINIVVTVTSPLPGRAIFASGSPFDLVEYNGKVYTSGQANNAYIFPGLGLGLIMSGAIRVHDDMLLAASEALTAEVTHENFDKGLIYPPFTNIRKISAHIAARVAAKAYELGLVTHLPQPENLVEYAESCMYNPNYQSYQ